MKHDAIETTTGRGEEPLRWSYETEGVDYEALAHLYKIAPLGEKTPEMLGTAFANSRYVCFVYAGERLVGVGRAIADGVDVSYLCDVAVHPDYRGRGIGTAIVSRLLECSRGYNKIILFTSMGKGPFYARLGFAKMNTAMAIFKNQQGGIELGLLKEMKEDQ